MESEEAKRVSDMPGYQIKTIKPGDGITYPKTGDTCEVHFTGTFENGDTFYSSRENLGGSFKFEIGETDVIRCWDEGVARMSKGERALLTCSAVYGYDMAGNPGYIPPNTVTNWDVELLNIEPCETL